MLFCWLSVCVGWWRMKLICSWFCMVVRWLCRKFFLMVWCCCVLVVVVRVVGWLMLCLSRGLRRF